MSADQPSRGRPPLNSEDFDRVETIFADTVDLAPDARVRVVDGACGDRPDLRAEVEALLEAHDLLAASSDEEEMPPAIGVGALIGAYRLVEKIGEGGMGDVYRAERVDGAFGHQVAVKLTRAAIADTQIIRRFKIERQILAVLRHPNIVTLLDGGATSTGHAYLVMECIEGKAITRHCREGALPLDERLRLFVPICSAVQHAHQHGIVHRDLKPANILIGSDGVPKVLDFGVAKLLEEPHGSGVTTVGMLPGPLTPNYASPEQLRGLPVTTASDVYALGVVLYEVVAGVRPYETEAQTLDRVLDLVIRTEPALPSAVGPDGPTLDLPYPRRRLRGDLDAIVLKALSKEVLDRYASAGELSSDITRYLAGQPVLARAPTASYLLRRLAARHKTLVAVTTLALLGILTASAVALWQSQVAQREQARAEQRFRDVRRLANTLIFKIHDAVMPLAGSTPVRRTIVDEALAYLEGLERESGGDPTLRLELAAAYRQIGGILGDAQRPNLGDRDGAIRQFERARAIVAPMATDTAHFDVVAALVGADRQLSTLHSQKSDHTRATALAREAVEYASRYRERHPDESRGLKLLAQASFQLAWTLPRDEAMPAWYRTLEYSEQLLAERPDDPDNQRNVALVDKYIGGALESTGDTDAVAKHYSRALELDEKRLAVAPDDRRIQFDAAISISNMASVSETRGNLDEAAALLERSLALRQHIADTDPADMQARERLAYILSRVARVHGKRGDLAAARLRAHAAVRVQQSVLEVTADRTAEVTLARALMELGRIERRARAAGAACDAYRRANRLHTQLGTESAGTDRSDAAEAARETAACDSVKP